MIRKTLTLVVVSLLLCGFSLSAEPVDHVPGDCAFFIQLEDMNGLLASVEKYAKQFGLPWKPGKLSNMISLQLIGRGGFPGIDMSRPAALFLMLDKERPMASEPRVALMIPVSDRTLFRQLVLPKIGGKKQAVVSYQDNYAFVSPEKATMESVLKGPHKKVNLIRNSQVSFHMDMTQFRTLFLQSMQSAARAARRVPLMRSLMLLYKDIIMQVDSQGYSLKLDDRGLEMGFRMEYKPGSDMAKVNADLGTGPVATLDLMPADSIALAASHVNWKGSLKMYDRMVGMVSNIDSQLGAAAHGFFHTLADSLHNELSLAMVPSLSNPGLNVVAAARVRSPQKLLDSVAETVKAINNIKQLKKIREKGDGNVGLSFKQNAESIADVPVHVVSLVLEPPSSATISSRDRKLIALVKSILTVRFTFLRRTVLVAMGPDGKTRLGDMARRLRGEGSSKGFKQSDTYNLMRKHYGRFKKNGVYYLSLANLGSELIKLVSLFEKDQALSAIGAMLEKMDTKMGGLYGYSLSEGNATTMRLLFTKNEIFGIFQLIVSQFTRNRKKNESPNIPRNTPD